MIIEYCGPLRQDMGRPVDEYAENETTDAFTKRLEWEVVTADGPEVISREIVWLKTHWKRKDGA